MKDIEIAFTDITISESKCSCDIICNIMNKEIINGDWMIESNVFLSNGKEESGGIIQFWRNKEAILVSYQSGFQDEVVPVDIMFLYEYLTENGWNFVISEDLVLSDELTWSRFFSIINDENEDNNNEDEDQIEDDDDEDMISKDFLEYNKKSKEYKSPTANKYNILSLKEFLDHDYDMKKRDKKEKESKF